MNSYKSGFYEKYINLMYLVVLNVIFIITCIPVFTAGPAVTALTYVIYMMQEGKCSSPIKMYFQSFSNYFKESVKVWLVQLVLMAGIVFDIWIVIKMNGVQRFIMIPLFLLLFIICIVGIYIYPFIGLFEIEFKKKLINAFNMAIANILYSIIMLIIVSIPVVLYVLLIDTPAIPLVYINLFGVSFAFYQNMLIIRKLLEKYKNK